jgi:transposase InsO family protein
VSLLREAEPGFGLGTLCGLFGYSRQTYYKRVDDEGFRQLALEPMIVDRVKEYRNDNPRLGSVKLWLMLKRQFEDTGCFPGRDAFIELLRRHGLMVKIRRRHHYVTTDSNHNYRRYPNLIKGMAVTAPNRVWVSDITYIETEEGVFYLSLVTDLYSHKIVGWSLGPTLDTTYPLEALHMALSTLPEGGAPYLIHHSDRGCQYCSHIYVETLKSRGIQISMTQSGDPLENAVAERANGILKTEWLCRMVIPDGKKCRTEVQRIIGFYNDERPHMSVGWQTPSEAHVQTGLQKRCWKNSWEKPPD